MQLIIFIKKLVKRAVFVFLFCCYLSPAICQQKYWQQHVQYHIDVTLHDTGNTLSAFEKIDYTNYSPDTLTFIWFHIWANAYKNNSTAFAKQMLINGSTDFYFSKQEDKGYIDGLDFKVNGSPAGIEQDANNIDIIKLLLPAPLLPGKTITITTPFTEKLPYNFSRGGHIGQTYQVTQWYPKPAVYDALGWHPMPYLDQGEFYAEYGDFEVRITVPGNYVVAASGDLQNKDELTLLKETGKLEPAKQKNYAAFSQLAATVKYKGFAGWESLMPASSTQTKTLLYTLTNAHDFAWFASKLFIVQYDTVKQAGQTIDVFTYYHPWQAEAWKNSAAFTKDAMHFYAKNVGDYPYHEVSVVAGTDNASSDGMEYPTITLITAAGDDEHNLDATITHEVGHNWFYGIIGSNERDHAWMDEGINTYYQKQYELEKYGFSDELGLGRSRFLLHRLPPDATAVTIATLEGLKRDEPMDTTAAAYSNTNYAMMAYEKTSIWMEHLHNTLGQAGFDSAMHHYYINWQFKHPYPADFKKSIDALSGTNIQALYNRLYATGPIMDSMPRKTIRFATFFNVKETAKYNYISFAPIISLNAYDKLMAGIFIHNYQLPLNRFNFFIAPMYAAGSKTFAGVARVAFNSFTPHSWLQAAVSASKFSINSYTREDGSKVYPSVIKLVPSIKLTLYDKDARLTKQWNFLLRSFILREEPLQPVANNTPIHTTINQLTISLADNRVLHPYHANLTIDQGAKFLRAGFTGNYFINYNKAGEGLQTRLFAGKFFYLTAKSPAAYNATNRYQLNMTGPHGYDDYTYSDYFVGRNTSTGVQSQQIMERDGFLKIPVNIFTNKSDNWLVAVNFTTDIPASINPFTLLPFKLPVYVFADVGTYGIPGSVNQPGGSVLYDAGLQVSLLSSAVNIYFPLLYSRVYHTYLKAAYGNNLFWKTISFNINLRAFKLNKINSNIPL